MKKRLLSLMIVGALLLVNLYGCGDNDNKQEVTPSQNQSQNDTDNDASNEDKDTTENDATEDDTTENDDATTAENIEEKAKEKFTEAISLIYNTDYSSSDEAKAVNDYVNANFTEETKEDMLKTLETYTSKISSSDFVITLIKKADNIDDKKYDATYNIRYTTTITKLKPFAYSDIIGTVVVDKSGNVLINKISEGNF